MHIRVAYIKEINEDTNGGKRYQKNNGNLLIYLPKKRLEYCEEIDKNYEAKDAMFFPVILL